MADADEATVSIGDVRVSVKNAILLTRIDALRQAYPNPGVTGLTGGEIASLIGEMATAGYPETDEAYIRKQISNTFAKRGNGRKKQLMQAALGGRMEQWRNLGGMVQQRGVDEHLKKSEEVLTVLNLGEMIEECVQHEQEIGNEAIVWAVEKGLKLPEKYLEPFRDRDGELHLPDIQFPNENELTKQAKYITNSIKIAQKLKKTKLNLPEIADAKKLAFEIDDLAAGPDPSSSTTPPPKKLRPAMEGQKKRKRPAVGEESDAGPGERQRAMTTPVGGSGDILPSTTPLTTRGGNRIGATETPTDSDGSPGANGKETPTE